MKKATPITTHLIFSIMIFAATSGLYWYMYQTVSSQVVSTNQALAEVATGLSQKAHEQSIADTHKQTEADRGKLTEFFIPYDQVVTLIEHIESIGVVASTDTKISTINADDISAGAVGDIGHVKVHVDAIGSWAGVMKTLTLAEHLPYSLTIDHLRLSYGGLTTKKWQASFDLDVLSVK